MLPQIFQVWHILTYFLFDVFILVNLFYVYGCFDYVYICDCVCVCERERVCGGGSHGGKRRAFGSLALLSQIVVSSHADARKRPCIPSHPCSS